MSQDSDESRPDPTPLKHKALRLGTGLLLFAALMFSWLWTPTYTNRVLINRARANYRPAKFIVSAAKFDEESQDGWLEGNVDGTAERLTPFFANTNRPTSASDLLARYPSGSLINILYNPEATEMIIQGEALRALEAAPDRWTREDALRHKLAWRVLVPFPLALALFIGVRIWCRFYANPPRDVISNPNTSS